MEKVVGLLLCFAAIAAIEFPSIWRRRQAYEMWVFGAIFLVSAAYCALFLLGIHLPDPNGLIRMAFGGIGAKLMQTSGP